MSTCHHQGGPARAGFELPPSPRLALFADLYELTMAQAYMAEKMNETAVFELFFRKRPANRSYIVVAGVSELLEVLERLRFTEEDLDYLRRSGRFSNEFLAELHRFRFTGDVYAMPEGAAVFPNEPLVQVVAPIAEAQLIETLVLNQIHFQSIAAAKASRVVTAAGGRQVVDFGSRRSHGIDAAVKIARASYLAGAAGTSNLLAGQLYGIPIFGTMAHSYIQAHEDEFRAFEAFLRIYPGTTLLVDTYDTLDGVRKVIELSRRLGPDFPVGAVRLDSGDLAALSREASALLNDGGLRGTKIFASSGLDERSIDRLVRAGAPIDGFGVGTKLAVIADGPEIDMVYKLVEYGGQPRMKLSADKAIRPGRKQIFRIFENGRMVRDVVGRADEKHPGKPLLTQVMAGGQRLAAGRISLEEARNHARDQRERLPESVRRMDPPRTIYPVEISPGLQSAVESLRPRSRRRRDPRRGAA